MASSETKDLKALPIPELAKILKVHEKIILEDTENGAPTNTDGTINLFNYTAWLIKEQALAT